MKNTKLRILSFILAAAMLTGCGASAESDSMTESSQNDSSSVDSYTDSESRPYTTDDSKSDSSSDESKSENAATTTKTSESKNESEKAVTTTKQSSTTTSAVATQPAATKATAKPVVTTKATQKPTVTAKQTTKATTKATPKVTQATSKSVLPSNATPLRKALYEIICCGKNIQANFKIVQQELIKYGKSLYPQYIVNSKLHGWVDNNGKYYDTTNNGQWTFLHYANAVDFYRTYLVGYSPVNTLEDVNYFENQLKNYVKNQLYRFRGLEDPKDGCWYITIGMWSNNQCAEITCVCGFTFDEQWK
ncbi:MAG: hypothetical protein IKH90_11070 [Ruminococcus sp.]|nr:hypothetical protein [Ruminococcus sp.]